MKRDECEKEENVRRDNKMCGGQKNGRGYTEKKIIRSGDNKRGGYNEKK